MEPIEHAMQLSDVTLLYEKNIGVKRLNLNLPKGSVYGFLGRNGAGKSTTLRVMSGVIRPQSGHVCVDSGGSNFVKTEWKKKIGYVPQNPVFPENLTPTQAARFLAGLYPTWQEERFEAMIGAFQLPVTRKIESFSFGMKSMLSVALAYAVDPEIYILDEPTSGLDPVSRRIVLDLIRTESSVGKSLIFSTHIVSDLYENCQQLGIIDYGMMLYEGNIADFSNGEKSLEENYFGLIECQQHQVVE